MTTYQNAYDSLADFMVTLDPVKVLNFHAPSDIQDRVEALLDKKQGKSGLSLAEQEELDHYFILEHIVRLAKSRARLHLSKAAA